MNISEICARARKEGWRFEYDSDLNAVVGINKGMPKMIFNVICFDAFKILESDQLGHAIAKEMNGEKDE